MKPVSDKITDGVELAIYEDCDVNHRFGMTKGGSLRHLGSGKCIQPADEVLISLCNCVCVCIGVSILIVGWDELF